MIDFIYNIIFGFDYPGLTKALDPITMGLLVSQGVGAIGKAIGAKQAQNAAEERLGAEKTLYDNMITDFESGKYDQKLSQDVRDVGEQQRILAEQATDAAVQRGTQSQQSALSAARYGDARSSAMIPIQARQIEQDIQGAELKGLQQKVAADAAVASAQQGVDAQNVGLAQQMGAFKLQRSAAGMDAAKLDVQQAKQAKIDAITDAVGTVGQGFAMGGGGGGGRVKNYQATTLEDILRPTSGSLASRSSSSVLNDSGNLIGIEDIELGEEEDIPLDFNMGNVLQQRNRMLGFDTFQGSGKKGMQYEFADKGGEVHVTKGEFSHKTNKKALVDEETGEKEAELTGDEAMVRDGDNVLVFNPEQQTTIEDFVNKGDAKGLMKKMKALLKKFNKENV